MSVYCRAQLCDMNLKRGCIVAPAAVLAYSNCCVVYLLIWQLYIEELFNDTQLAEFAIFFRHEVGICHLFNSAERSIVAYQSTG